MQQVLLEKQENAIIIMSDEVHFHLSGEGKKQNLHYWGGDNPLIIHKKPLQSLCVTVWCATGIFRFIGLYFLEDASSATVTLDAECYVHMLNTCIHN